MPNRILREAILDSAAVNLLGPAEEVFYRRLLSAVDDFGRFDARPAVLRSRLYPLQLDQVAEADVAAWLAACAAADLVELYQADGKPYLTYKKFEVMSRARRSKFPAPPASVCAPKINEHYEHSYSGSGSNSNSNAHAHTDGDDGGAWVRAFEKFWQSYPKADGLAEASLAWALLDPGPAAREELLAAILAGVGKARRSPAWQREEGRFVPRAVNWLSDRAWEKFAHRPRRAPPVEPVGAAAGGAAAWRALRILDG